MTALACQWPSWWLAARGPMARERSLPPWIARCWACCRGTPGALVEHGTGRGWRRSVLAAAARDLDMRLRGVDEKAGAGA